jgi:hypothetical protein
MTPRESRNVAVLETLLERRAQRRRLIQFAKGVLILLAGVGAGALFTAVWR